MQSFFINQCQCMLLPVYERSLAGRNSQPGYQSDHRNIYLYFTPGLKKYQTLQHEHGKMAENNEDAYWPTNLSLFGLC